MTLIPSRLFLAIGLAFASCQAVAVAQSSPATLFDQHVAAGLPQAFALPRVADDERGEGVDQVVVEEKLDTDVVFPDGRHAMSYTGTANGFEAMFTRIGAELSMSVFDEQALSGASAAAQRVASRGPGHAVSPPEAFSAIAPQRLTATATQKELQFWIFLHDNAGEANYGKFHNWYIAWWIRDLERTVKPGIPVKVFIKDRIPGVTDLDYHKGTATEALVEFRTLADSYVRDTGARASRLTKTMLFVGERPANWDGDYGRALPNDTAAMASGTGPRHGVAHEFGHTLDALHEYGENRFPCVTNMMPYTPLLHSCRIYSGANDVQIREYVRDALARESDD